MAGRQRATFQKRQKELKRMERQKEKAEKRAARKAEKARGREPGNLEPDENLQLEPSDESSEEID
jgi:hypothetical protein